jgi:hypothetical protein
MPIIFVVWSLIIAIYRREQIFGLLSKVTGRKS